MHLFLGHFATYQGQKDSIETFVEAIIISLANSTYSASYSKQF